ncbi:IS66 family transposase [Pseudomonas umsongensis]|uniref:IS66 family transposase n=1 Tax=Pseudomonas umsongensis TaxID=198618 RepID=UPI003D80865F
MQPQRRSYSKSFKTQVIQECAQPGASIASIALSHSLNANLVHKWIRVQAQKCTALQPAFIPLPMQLAVANSHAAASNICVEIQHPRGTVKVNWPTENKQKPKRTALPTEFPRTLIHHELDNTHCPCGCALKRIGEGVSVKLDYKPGVFTVERHVRGKWVCDDCETLIQAPVPAQVIDKGIPTAGLLAHVMIAKFADHLPLYRQESIFGRAGLAIPRSTLAQWVGMTGVQLQPLVDALRVVVLGQQVIHADETPVQMLMPGTKKTHRSHVWAYATSQFCETAAVVYDFSPSRAGEHARNFLQGWKGKLVCDDFGGYKASFELGVSEIGCMAHARRKFFELHVTNKSQLAEQALRYIQLLYEIESEVRDLEPDRHDPYAYLKDVLTRLPTQRASEIDQLLPHKWQPV